jgi:hypothetical protein
VKSFFVSEHHFTKTSMSENTITNPNLYDLACALLIEFHEHTILRIPDLNTSLLALLTPDDNNSDSKCKDFDDSVSSSLPIGFDISRATLTVGQTTLIQFVDRINQQYKEELDRINRVDSELCDEIVRTLRAQSQYRPITVTEVNVHILSVHKKVIHGFSTNDDSHTYAAHHALPDDPPPSRQFDMVRAMLRSRYAEWMASEIATALRIQMPPPDPAKRPPDALPAPPSATASASSAAAKGPGTTGVDCQQAAAVAVAVRRADCGDVGWEARCGWDSDAAAALEASHWFVS